jgi:hypothetical protein
MLDEKKFSPIQKLQYEEKNTETREKKKERKKKLFFFTFSKSSSAPRDQNESADCERSDGAADKQTTTGW